MPNKKEDTETEMDETKEPSVEQAQESADGTEGVILPEEYQTQVHKLVHKAKKHHLDHIRSRVNAREDELRKEEMAASEAKSTKGKGKTMPTTMSAESMPSSY